MALNPMHQFEVYKIGPEINLGKINLSFISARLNKTNFRYVMNWRHVKGFGTHGEHMNE